MKCRICRSERVVALGVFAPYLDYEVRVYGCEDCGSRYAPRDEGAYERLHANTESTYGKHYRSATEAKSILEDKGAQKYRRFLYEVPKYKHVVEAIKSEKGIKRILEMGCSTGVLGAYFIEKGYHYKGVDVSGTAVDMARKSFGPHFYKPEELLTQDSNTYDAIYFVGTIGCVEDPLDFVRQALSRLRSGGILIFNAPNVEACEIFDDIWLSGTSPPDLVNLFNKNIWKLYFSDQARIYVEVEAERPERVLKKIVRKIVFGTSMPKASENLCANKKEADVTANKGGGKGSVRFGRIRSMLSVIYHHIVNYVFALVFGKRYPSEFGQYIIMRKE